MLPMPPRQTTRPVPHGSPPQNGPPTALSPVSIPSYAAVEAAGKLQSAAALYAASTATRRGEPATRVAGVGEVELMLAWLAGYEAADRAALDSLRQQIQSLAGAGQTATGNGSAPNWNHPAQV